MEYATPYVGPYFSADCPQEERSTTAHGVDLPPLGATAHAGGSPEAARLVSSLVKEPKRLAGTKEDNSARDTAPGRGPFRISCLQFAICFVRVS